MDTKLLFSADGLRGVVGNWPLNKNGIISFGRAIGDYIKSLDLDPLVMIGMDTRPSSPQIYKYLKYGLISKGIQIQNLDVVTTPTLAYFVKNSTANLGLMITASHNPVEFNGIKIIESNGKRLSDDAGISIERFMWFSESEADGYVEYPYVRPESSGFAESYVDDQISQSNLDSLKGVSLVIDCANGSTSSLIPNALKKLSATIHVVNQYDGKNLINSQCGTEYFRYHRSEFASIVQENEADYGISFDGDGDRLIIVDKAANFYNGDDFLFALGTIFSRIGSLNKNTIVTTHMANSGLITSLETFGINAVQTRNGDKYLEDQIIKNNYSLGGEQFGNIIIHDQHHVAADPFYALMYMLKEMKKSTLLDLVRPLKKLPQVLATIKANVESSNSQLSEQVDLIIYRLGVGSRVRMWHSSTQPGLFNIMLEGIQGCTIEVVLEEARKLCAIVSGQKDLEVSIIPLSERVY